MAENYYRAQILMEPGQHSALKRIAEREARSISDVARQVINLGLESLEKDHQARYERRGRALERLNQIREEAQSKYGVYHGDLIEEVRSERENGLDQNWRAES